MKGSEKQINWAEQIQAKVVAIIDEMIQKVSTMNDSRTTEAIRQMRAIRYNVVNAENAADVIDLLNVAESYKQIMAAINVAAKYDSENTLAQAIIADIKNGVDYADKAEVVKAEVEQAKKIIADASEEEQNAAEKFDDSKIENILFGDHWIITVKVAQDVIAKWWRGGYKIVNSDVLKAKTFINGQPQ